ncbi:YhcG family protein [Segetibacter sp. 3557_3]|uniref:PDDEXK nuclease domain-containing protein n=1 Tax=Segetibacter sp. 3557_3 TaxID=2547429 RepID=UPI001A9E8BF0|nr:PDDEXK nuclease domain-containing protein [Segetibacter sp. 3557_3]
MPNAVAVLLYWQIGKTIIEQQQQASWGDKITKRLADDLKREFPDIKGFSLCNLNYMRQFASAHPDFTIVQRPVAQLPCGHHVVLIDKVKDEQQRTLYMQKSLENGWSRDVLSLQIKGDLHIRQGSAVRNFTTTLPSPQSDLARQTLKDPYIFDFLTMSDDYKEKDLEKGLVEHITKFLVELGAGFAYVGKQYPIEAGGRNYALDLLFYHLKLSCYIVIEFKIGEFKPEHAGKLNFYLSVVDDTLRHPDDQPTIGLLICQDKNRIIAVYALKDIQKPIRISEYQLTTAIPENLKGSLPTIKELEEELQSDNDNRVS